MNLTAIVTVVGAIVTVVSLSWGIIGDRSRLRYLERVTAVAKDVDEASHARRALGRLQDGLAQNLLDRYQAGQDLERRISRWILATGIGVVIFVTSFVLTSTYIPSGTTLYWVFVVPEVVLGTVVYAVFLSLIVTQISNRRSRKQTAAARQRSAEEA